MKRFLMLFICLCLCAGLFPMTAAAAPQWPSDVSIQADAGIVMDSDTGTVLYGKNMDQPYYPASITKILTALIVLEQCDLNEMVTFSHDDVYNVEAGSSSAGIDEGDVLTVRDCLYALMLASANESANALACHVSGSREAFAQLMNERARAGAPARAAAHLRVQLVPGNRGDHERARGCHDLLAVFGVLSGLIL